MAWLNALLAVVVVFTYTVGTLLVWSGFQTYPDHSPVAVFRWIAIYVVAVVQPIVWSVYHVRVLRSKGLEIDRQLRAVAFSPMVVGGVTLLIALNLISGR
jgi:uncharacterized membrane protein